MKESNPEKRLRESLDEKMKEVEEKFQHELRYGDGTVCKKEDFETFERVYWVDAGNGSLYGEPVGPRPNWNDTDHLGNPLSWDDPVDVRLEDSTLSVSPKGTPIHVSDGIEYYQEGDKLYLYPEAPPKPDWIDENNQIKSVPVDQDFSNGVTLYQREKRGPIDSFPIQSLASDVNAFSTENPKMYRVDTREELIFIVDQPKSFVLGTFIDPGEKQEKSDYRKAKDSIEKNYSETYQPFDILNMEESQRKRLVALGYLPKEAADGDNWIGERKRDDVQYCPNCEKMIVLCDCHIDHGQTYDHEYCPHCDGFRYECDCEEDEEDDSDDWDDYYEEDSNDDDDESEDW